MSKRDIRLDTLRGILLAFMTLNHLGVMATRQPFGFVSAAEGFILLSAYTYAITSQIAHVSFLAMLRTSGKRAFKIYKYHILSFFLLLAVVLAVPAYDRYFGHSFVDDQSVMKTVAGALLLVHQPTYFDILPMYIVFALLTPVLLYALGKGRGAWVLLGSVALWMAGQLFDPVPAVAEASGISGSDGFFNLFGWQLLWVTGLYLGYAHKHQGRTDLAPSRASVLIAAAIVVFCILARHGIVVLPAGIQFYFDKSDLGFFRFANVIAQLVLLLALLRLIDRHAGLPWFRFIGTYSLQVFTWHVLVVYLAEPLTMHVAKQYGFLANIGFDMLVVASLSLPALLYREVLKRRARAVRRAPPVVLAQPGPPS
ncbi:OpgC domain-containing protein [Massilia sp. IC2-278]|uniref:OpgC domain-containing protein n=1 Tax=Massilia sp. IC2-278 TaxID=2887200 RepID=UPI001E559135|nr:OpgC domain-containing protein [Massilia sp. IC2-278]MCC2959986.1 OpgC domain-containing protein [Massilia sp. IC2-278]